MSQLRDALAEALSRIVAEEARRNELRVGVVRVAAYGLVVVLDGALAALGLRPLENLLFSSLWALIAVALYAALRLTAYRHLYRFAVPFIDAALIYGLLFSRGAGTGDIPLDLGTTAAVTCGLFAATGGIRFDRKAALWTTGLAAAVFVELVGRHLPGRVSWLYGLIAIAAIGLLNMWLAGLVRRSMQASQGRALLGRFLPRSLLDSAFQDPLAVLAEPRTVDATILFTDLRGFTALSESLPPAEVMALLSDVQGALADEVRKAGGVVDKFIGDGMLAVFGVTEEERDHAAQALAAVRGIQSAMERLREREGPALKLGMGVHSGSVVTGCLGSGDRLELTVIGDTVNTASRLESMTKERGVDVLISEETARRAGETLVDLGEVAIRGRQQALRVHTLPNERAGRLKEDA